MVHIRFTNVLPYMLVGAVVNVGVAWLCAVCVDTSSGAYASSGQSSLWTVIRYSRAGATMFWSQRIGGPPYEAWDGSPEPTQLLPSWSYFAEPTPELASGVHSYDIQYGDARGWPMLALWSSPRHSYETKVNGILSRIDLPVAGGIPTALEPWKISYYDSPKTLPLRPIWVGFAVNSAIYALVVWLAAYAARSLRRSFRRSCGKCPSCAYPVGDTFVCSECGHRVKSALKTSDGNRATPPN